MEIPFIGGAYLGRSKNLNAQVCQNLMPIVDQQGGKSVLALMGTPGASLWCTSGVFGEVRGMTREPWNGELYFVVKDTLLKTRDGIALTTVGTISSLTGKVWFAGGTNHLMLIDGEFGWYTTGTTLWQITDTDFSTPSSLTYQDGFFIITEDGTDQIYISASENAGSWAALDFESAEVQPDEAKVVISDNRELRILGETTSETHYNSGDSDMPFQQVSGAVIPIGVGADNSVAFGPEGLFWLDNLFRVVSMNGYGVIPISTPQIDYQIQQFTTKNDAIGYTYSQEGHGFYVLTFPSADKTLVFDASTSFWHTRSSNVNGGRHLGNCYAWFLGKHLVGHYQNGNIYELDLDIFTDAGETTKAIRRIQAIHRERKRIFHHIFEVEHEAGTGLLSGQGSDPQAMLRWSNDGCHTWSHEHWRSIGKMGEYHNRSRWAKLGQARDRIYEWSMTDPVKKVIVGAHLEATPGAS